jgi:hypothetical protein
MQNIRRFGEICKAISSHKDYEMGYPIAFDCEEADNAQATIDAEKSSRGFTIRNYLRWLNTQPSLVDGGIRIDWNGGKSKDLWCWIAVIYWRKLHDS